MTVDIINEPSPEQIKPLLQAGMRAFNYPFLGDYELKRFAMTIKNEAHDLIAGVYGFVLEKHNTLRIEYLWVDEHHRHRGLGSKLIQEVEKYAQTNHCKRIQLSTMAFQGTDFYIKMGYRLIGKIPKWFCDWDELFFVKELKSF